MARILPPGVAEILERAAHLSDEDVARLKEAGVAVEPLRIDQVPGTVPADVETSAHTDAYMAARRLADPQDLAVIDAFVNSARQADWGNKTVAARLDYTAAVMAASDAATAILVQGNLAASDFELLYGPWRLLE
jgi:hypothetical protein